MNLKKIIFSIFLLGIYANTFSQTTIPVNEQYARIAPEWLQKGIIYQIQPRAFTPEGTLPAATKRLKDVAKIGVTIVYLCSVFVADDNEDQRTWSPRQKASKMNNAKNPYRMMDYYHVDPEYGNDDDLKTFVNECHRLGLRIMLDMVYLHCGSRAVFLKENPDFVKRDKNGEIINAGWNWPALNYKNTKLREYLWENMEYWVKNFDVDGFRMDVAYGVPLDFWETARTRLEKIRPDIGMLAEAHEYRRPEDQLKAFDVSYSSIYFNDMTNVLNGKYPVSHLRNTWNKIANKCPKNSRFIHYFDNHDTSNNDWYNRKEKSWGFDACNAVFVHLFTLDGIPFIYNGQEIADTARHSIFGKAPIAWNRSNTYAGQTRFKFLQTLCGLYKKEQALINGDLVWISNNQPNSVLSYLRDDGSEQIMIIINLSNYPVRLKIEPLECMRNKKFNSLLEKGIISGSIEKGFEIQAYGFLVSKMM